MKFPINEAGDPYHGNSGPGGPLPTEDFQAAWPGPPVNRESASAWTSEDENSQPDKDKSD